MRSARSLIGAMISTWCLIGVLIGALTGTRSQISTWNLIRRIILNRMLARIATDSSRRGADRCCLILGRRARRGVGSCGSVLLLSGLFQIRLRLLMLALDVFAALLPLLIWRSEVAFGPLTLRFTDAFVTDATVGGLGQASIFVGIAVNALLP